MELSPEQHRAVDQCSDNTRRLVCVTGPAGSGKTTILKRAHASWLERGARIALAAPTGKAARRITEATGIEALTIHRLLEYTDPGSEDRYNKGNAFSYPKRDEDNPLPLDVIFVDEYSMVNPEVHQALVKAMPRGCVLRAFGDINQLKPVVDNEVYNGETKISATLTPFEKLLDATEKQGTLCRLERVFRQGEGSGILGASQRLLKKAFPMQAADFKLRMVGGDFIMAAQMKPLIEARMGTDMCPTKTHTQIITLSHMGEVGTFGMNTMIQDMRYNDDEPRVTQQRKLARGTKTVRFFLGDKVIYNKNNYDLDVMNGDIGVVVEIAPLTAVVKVDFGNNHLVEFRPRQMFWNQKNEPYYRNTLQWLDPAYAITTHKSQGSEFDHVIYVLAMRSRMLCTVSNAYTAVTRAKKHCELVTCKKVFDYLFWNPEK